MARLDSQTSETAPGGVPWDIGTIQAIKQELQEKDLLFSQPISQDDVVFIMAKGAEMPYTQQARKMFAKNALISLSNRKQDETREELLGGAVRTVKARLGIV